MPCPLAFLSRTGKKNRRLKIGGLTAMMRRRPGKNGQRASEEEDRAARIEWEMTPGGMLVQKRSATPNADRAAPAVRVRISFGAARYEVDVGARATFGELKKLLIIESGLQPGEQRLIYRGKERENGEYLDICGVKDHSKLVLMEDQFSQEKRYIEMQKNAEIQSVHRAISDISMEVDKLADQVTTIGKSVSNGQKVAEVQITTMIELLMRQAIKLDSIPAKGETSSQKNIQGKRVQKCVETLDVLKISNAGVKPVVVATKWETFESPTTTQWEFFD